MHAMALLRCSTDHQDLDHQRQAATRWAEAEGVVLEVVEEPATSGAALRRPGLERVLKACRSGRVNVLWVRELSRLGRDAVLVLQVARELDRLDVRLVIQSLGVDTSTAAGRLVLGVMAQLAEFEREQVRERVRSGLQAARKRGQRLGRPELRWTPDEVATVRELVAGGMSPETIARQGAVKVFRRTAGGDEVPVVPSASAIRRVLRASA